MRVAYYVLMAAMESPTAQTKGICSIWYLLDWGSDQLKSVNGKVRNALPVHFASLHLCYNDTKEFSQACIAIQVLNTRNRVRYRPHFGKILFAKAVSETIIKTN
jgi:hypothetical protein